MAAKYGDLVQPLKFKKGPGGGNARELVFVSGAELGGFDFNFIIGVYNETGDWAPNRGAHSHTFDECLLFFGYDDNDMNYLGSDLSLAVGKEREVHKYSVPMVVAAPKGFPHCPLITEKVYRPFGHFHLALAADYSGGPEPEEGTTDGNKYTEYFNEMKAAAGPGGADSVQEFTVSGGQLQGIPINFRMGLHNETGQWQPGKGAQVHPYNACLVFFGHNVDDMYYLGAEISVELGEEHEKHTFDVPTVVALPKGTPYGPIVCNRLDRPYGSMLIGLDADYKSDWME